jgi:hypothetical protein
LKHFFTSTNNNKSSLIPNKNELGLTGHNLQTLSPRKFALLNSIEQDFRAFTNKSSGYTTITKTSSKQTENLSETAIFLEIQKMKQMQKQKYQQIIEASIKNFDKDK